MAASPDEYRASTSAAIDAADSTKSMVSMAMSVLFHLAPERARLQDRRVVARHPWIGHAGRVVDELQVRPEAAEHHQARSARRRGRGRRRPRGRARRALIRRRVRSDAAAAAHGASHGTGPCRSRASPAAGRAARRSARGRRSQPRPRWRSRTGPCGSCRRGTSPSSTRR